MDELNNYIFNICKLVYTCQTNGTIRKPVKYKLNKHDKKVLNNVYDVYKIYRMNITRKEFIKMCINYSISSGINIIKSGSNVGQLIEKIKNK